MRYKLKVKNLKGEKVQIENEIPAKDHLAAQIRYKSVKFVDRTKYTRKRKYKKNYSDED